MNSEKHVAILHYSVPPAVGGIENIIYHHLRLLYTHGFDLSVIAARGDEGYYEASFFHHVDYQTIPELYPLHPEVQSATAALETDPAAFEDLRDRIADALRSLLANCSACFVHNAITAEDNYPLTAALRILSNESLTKFIAWSHEFPLPGTPEPTTYPKNLSRQAWPGVTYITSSIHKQRLLAETLNLPLDEVLVIPPGIQPDTFLKWELPTYGLVHSLNLLQCNPVLLMPSRLAPGKGLEQAVKVMASLVETRPSAVLLVSGNPLNESDTSRKYLQRLKNQRKKLCLEEHIHFIFEHGEQDIPLNVSEAVLADLFEISDLLFLPGQDEGFGMPVLGAGLARLPVFAASLDPTLEVTDSHAHFFDPKAKPDQIASQLVQILEADPTYNLRHQILREYRWDAIFEAHILPLLSKSLSSSNPTD